MKRFLAIAISIIMCFCSVIMPVSAINVKVDDNVLDAPSVFGCAVEMCLGTAYTSTGGSVALPIVITNNQGFYKANLSINYDFSAVQLIKVVSDSFTVCFEENKGKTVIEMEYNGEENFTGTGEVAILTFIVKGSFQNVPVSFDGLCSVYNKTGDKLLVEYTDGSVTSECSHNYSSYTVIKQATCLENGIEAAQCSVCGHTVTREIAMLSHTSGTWGVYKPANCTDGGLEALYCDRCNTVLDTRVTSPIGHSMGWVVTKEATCTELGVKTYMCVICSDEIEDTQYIPVKSHEAGGTWTVVEEPTCSQEGKKAILCKYCTYEFSTEPIAKTPHQKTKLVIVKAPTSEQEGEGEYRCLACDEVVKTVTFEKVNGKIHGDKVAYAEDGKVRIPVKVENNSGFSYGVIRVKYDKEKFEYSTCSAGDMTSDITVGESEDGQVNILVCLPEENINKNGTLFYLDFDVLVEMEKDEESFIEIFYNPQGDFSTLEGEHAFFNFEGVTVKAFKVIPGDVDGNGEVDTVDLAKMKLYLVGAINEIGKGAYIDDDDKIDTVDLALLKLYLAGSITLG